MLQPRLPPGAASPSSHSEDDNGPQEGGSLHSVLGEKRFVGDMNPEAALLGHTDSLCKDKHRNVVGLFHRNTDDPPSDDETDTREDQINVNLQMHVRVQLHDYLTAIGAFDMPSIGAQEKLVSIYFENINTILPILDRHSFLQSWTSGTASQLLVQAVCLVAAKDDEAIQFLCFHEDSPPLSPRTFCTKLYTGLSASVNANLESDHIVLARVLALMSLHVEGFRGADTSSMHLAQAIHHSQSVGLQIASSEDDPQISQRQDVFWCLWSLDKLHASMDGRPIIIADRDISVSKPARGVQGKAAFEIWLKISEMLATSIDFYRPTARPNTTGWEEDFPSFEDVVGEEISPELRPEILGKRFTLK